METEGEELEDVYRYVAMQMDEEVLNNMENSEFSIPKFQVVHCVFFLQGYINIMTYESRPTVILGQIIFFLKKRNERE